MSCTIIWVPSQHKDLFAGTIFWGPGIDFQTHWHLQYQSKLIIKYVWIPAQLHLYFGAGWYFIHCPPLHSFNSHVDTNFVDRLQHAQFTTSIETTTLGCVRSLYHAGMQIRLHRADISGRQRTHMALDVDYNSVLSVVLVRHITSWRMLFWLERLLAYQSTNIRRILRKSIG